MPTIVASPLTNPMPPLLALQLATGCHTAARLSRAPLQPDQRPQPADLPPAEIEGPASRDRRRDQDREGGERPHPAEQQPISDEHDHRLVDDVKGEYRLGEPRQPRIVAVPEAGGDPPPRADRRPSSEARRVWEEWVS